MEKRFSMLVNKEFKEATFWRDENPKKGWFIKYNKNIYLKNV